MRHAENELTRLVSSVVEPMGYEFVGIQLLSPGQAGALLRVYIDKVGGEGRSVITVDDCGAVSHQLSGVLDVADLIAGHYTLEVSSPGLDRPLFTPEHFQRFRGQTACLRLAAKIEERRKLQGRIEGMSGEAVLLGVDGRIWEIPLGMVESARLVPEL